VTLEITLLGTGTSTGVPRIACDCAVCTSTDPRNRRLRAGVRIDVLDEGGDPRGTLLVDTSPDLREQALTHDIRRVDAVLFTHAHADHVYGLDDVRVFNFIQHRAIPLYGSAATLAAVRRSFAYVWEKGQEGGGKPLLEPVPVAAPFELLGRTVEPLPVWHGDLEVTAYRIGGFALVTDVSVIPEETMARLAGLDLLVLGALRYRRHSTHLSIGEAVEVARRLGARRTVLTHIAHEVDATAPELELPPGVELGWDGMRFEVG
jgi:phosphoribosyl 1,2-cyclic phosphate phosphodiesterase